MSSRNEQLSKALKNSSHSKDAKSINKHISLTKTAKHLHSFKTQFEMVLKENKPKNNSKNKQMVLNTSINSSLNNDFLIGMSKYKKYHPPEKYNLNKSHIKSVNNTAIGNEYNRVSKNNNLKKMFQEKLEEKIGIAEEIFNDDNLLEANVVYEKDGRDSKLLLNSELHKERMNYEEWNNLKEKSTKIGFPSKGEHDHSESKLRIQRQENKSISFNKMNTSSNINSKKQLEPFFQVTSSNQKKINFSATTRKTLPINSTFLKENSMNNNDKLSLYSNISILKYLKSIFGKNLERFDEKGN